MEGCYESLCPIIFHVPWLHRLIKCRVVRPWFPLLDLLIFLSSALPLWGILPLNGFGGSSIGSWIYSIGDVTTTVVCRTRLLALWSPVDWRSLEYRCLDVALFSSEPFCPCLVDNCWARNPPPLLFYLFLFPSPSHVVQPLVCRGVLVLVTLCLFD